MLVCIVSYVSAPRPPGAEVIILLQQILEHHAICKVSETSHIQSFHVCLFTWVMLAQALSARGQILVKGEVNLPQTHTCLSHYCLLTCNSGKSSSCFMINMYDSTGIKHTKSPLYQIKLSEMNCYPRHTL